MKEGSSVYTNPDEYGMELAAHIRMLAQSYLSWRQNSPFSVPYGNEQPEETLRETGKSELIEILWQEKQVYAAMRQKAVRSAAEHTIIPMEYLFRIQRADDFLCHCAAMALAPELDGGIGELYAKIPENHGKTRPTVELCICLYSVDPERRIGCMRNVFEEKEAFAFFFGREVRWGSQTELRLDTRILQFIFSPESEPEPLRAFCRLYHGSEIEETPMVVREELSDRLAAFLTEDPKEKRILYLYGGPGSGRRSLIQHTCRKNRRFCLEADAGKMAECELEKRLDELVRETLIRRAVLCVRNFQSLFQEDDSCQALYVIRRLLQELPLVILIADRKWMYGREDFPAPFTELELTAPDIGERVNLWKEAFRRYPGAQPDSFLGEERKVEMLAGKFAFQPGQIMDAAGEAVRMAWWKGKKVDEEALYQACRHQVSHRLGEKATLIQPSYGWEDLILPPEHKQVLRNACNQIEYAHQVYGTWGFSTKMAYGRGVSMLFYGPPGTGKTMGAQVLARELHLELYKADLSCVMSKYIGETEKNLGEIFEEVKKSQSILFFDEADALFGKRSEVKDAQDKYANAETAYLLQKMEEYEGIVILATNYMQNFDEAFKRRIRFMIEFPLPDAGRRRQIWQRVYPKETPVSEEVDFDFLADQFELSGSSIKNIAVSAAFRAAAAGTEIEMGQILDCLREEMKKSGKNLQKEDFGPYYSLMNGKGELEDA